MRLALVLSLVAVVSCSDSSGSRGTRTLTPRLPVQLEATTLQTATAPVAIGSDLVYLVSEALRNADLDGDGLLDHQVVSVLDAVTGQERSLGVSADADLVAGDGYFAFFQAETDTGDRNGDGDTDDRYLWLHALDTDVTTDLLSTAVAAQAIEEDLLFTVDEAEEAFDWNADGDMDDLVGRFRDTTTGVSDVTGLSGDSVFGGVIDRQAVFVEQSSGEVQVLDLDTGGLLREGFGAVGLAVGGDFVAFHSDEALLGMDLNRDGVLDDLVVSIFDARTGLLRRTPIALAGVAPYAFTSEFVAFPTAFQGSAGVAVVDVRSAVARLVPLEVSDLVGVGEQLLASVDEAAVAMDLDGDGDATGIVAHLIDPASLSVTNLGVVAVERLVRSTEAWLAVDEAATGRDLDGDGMQTSRVLHRLDTLTGDLENLGLAAGVLGVLDERFLLLDVAEARVDLTGDGDLLDRSLHLLELASGRATNLQLAVVATGDLVDASYRGVAPVQVSEAGQGGVDRNGDGDALDTLLVLVKSEEL